MKTWYMCNNYMVFVQTIFFLIMIYVADMVILMSNFADYDIDQISLKFVQR